MVGVVEATGRNCKAYRAGDKVFGLLPGGSYVQYVVIPEAMALSIPEQFLYEQAAAIPEVFLTPYQTQFWIGRLETEETVLMHAGARGVGMAVIQLAKEGGAVVLTTTGSDEKCQQCRSLGAVRAINYRTEDFTTAHTRTVHS